MILGPIPVILIQQTFSLDNSLGVPDDPDPQEAMGDLPPSNNGRSLDTSKHRLVVREKGGE